MHWPPVRCSLVMCWAELGVLGWATTSAQVDLESIRCRRPVDGHTLACLRPPRLPPRVPPRLPPRLPPPLLPDVFASLHACPPVHYPHLVELQIGLHRACTRGCAGGGCAGTCKDTRRARAGRRRARAGAQGEVVHKYGRDMVPLFTDIFQWLPLAHVIGRKVIFQWLPLAHVDK